MDFFFSFFFFFFFFFFYFLPFLFGTRLLSIPSKEKVELEMVCFLLRLKELEDQEMLQPSIEMLTHRIFPSPVQARLSHPIIREEACSSGGCVDSASSVFLSIFFFCYHYFYFLPCILKFLFWKGLCDLLSFKNLILYHPPPSRPPSSIRQAPTLLRLVYQLQGMNRGNGPSSQVSPQPLWSGRPCQ